MKRIKNKLCPGRDYKMAEKNSMPNSPSGGDVKNIFKEEKIVVNHDNRIEIMKL